MKKIILILCVLPFATQAQNFHFSGRFGLSGYHGDLQEKIVSLSQLKLMGSLGVQYDLSERFIMRSYLTLTSLHADDKKGNDVMQKRNLNFSTKLFDWEASLQYNILDLNYSWWSPYVFTGVGLYHFKPYTKDAAGDKYFLPQLSTEGQGFVPGVDKYSLTQFNVPLGIGAVYSLNEDTRLGLEVGYRMLFTDYLDDVSGVYVDQGDLLTARGPKAVELAYRGGEVHSGTYPAAGVSRGNPDNRDGYYYVALTLTVRYFFDKYKQIAGLPSSKKGKKVGCPAARY